MGAYLSEPLTTKDSNDESNEFVISGSSSMQGWRITQEDAHNSILNYDDKTSFFAVYDGHGGPEVALYCSLYLPKYLKALKAYEKKDFMQALKDAFIGFDGTLLENKVIEELKKLADKDGLSEDPLPEDDDEVEEEEDDNVDDLCKLARMPLNEVLQMYKKNPSVNRVKEGNCSKPLSPYLKGKKKTFGDESCCSGSMPTGIDGEDLELEAKALGFPDTADATVSSSSNKAEGSVQKPSSSSGATEKVADQSDEISDTDNKVPTKAIKEDCAPDSSSKTDEEEKSKHGETPTLNGDVNELPGKSAVSSSNQENGDVSSNTSAGINSNSCSEAGSSSGSKPVAKLDNSLPGSSSSSSSPSGSKRRDAKNGSKNLVEDDSEDDDETDEEFPPVAECNETSSTEDGEEETFCSDASEEVEDEECCDGEYDEDEEDYMNEEDEAFMSNITDEPGKASGCTAVVALLHDKQLFVANAGDSRCVVCRNGKALDMSIDHKPEDQIEYDRIQKAGGRVTLDGRVNGGLNLSRAIGDHGYKLNKKLPPEEQMISALPDIKSITIGPEDEFMVLACDGIWNFMTSDDVVEFVQERIKDPKKKLSEICEEMFDYCLAPHTKGDGTGCDNMTAILVQFKPTLTGAMSRKRTASIEPETAADESDCKKVKTDVENAATTVNENKAASSSTTCDESEAASAVATIESSASTAESGDNTASSST